MTVTAAWYGKGLQHVASGDVAYVTDTIKAALMGDTFVVDQDTHEFWSDVAANEVPAGAGYTAGGQALATKSVGYVAATNRVPLLAAATVWTAGVGETLTGRFAVVYQDTGTATSSVLLGLVDFGADVSATNDDFTITWDATDGVLYVQAADYVAG